MAVRPLQVICIHGAGGGGWEWIHWRPVLEAHGFRALAPDLMPSPQGIAATQLRHYAEQVVALAEQALRSGSVALAGASMGGLLALQGNFFNQAGAFRRLLSYFRMNHRIVAPRPPVFVHEAAPGRTAHITNNRG